MRRNKLRSTPADDDPGTTVHTGQTIRIGIDIGGTFTDLQILNDTTGALHSYKTPTTPDDPSCGLVDGIAAAGQRFRVCRR